MLLRHQNLIWWIALGLIWSLSCVLDHSWLQLDQRLPSWDQAEYLSSAIEHGRQLGVLVPGQWEGFQALLYLSPKIPPLSSIFSGSLMAIVGQNPDQAGWVLSFWHGVILLTVASWGRCIGGRRLGLLAALFLAMAPGMAEHRVEFTLDIALTGTTTLALFLLTAGSDLVRKVANGLRPSSLPRPLPLQFSPSRVHFWWWLSLRSGPDCKL